MTVNDIKNDLSTDDVVDPSEEVFVFPVSYAQQRLWFLDQFEPGSPFYNIPTAVRLTGRLDALVLERSLNEIVRRHEALRTTFSTIDGEPVQVIHPELYLTIPLIDLTDLPPDQREPEAMRLANLEASKPFNLQTGPVIRVTLLRVSDDEHIVQLTMHHIVSDGWSIGVLIFELSTLYEAFVTGRPSPLPELAIQYADFSEWQREWLQGDVLEGQVNYWLKQLSNGVPVLELPTDHPRPPVLTSRGAAYSTTLPKTLLEPIKKFSQEQGATLFMTLLAAFQTLLYRYTAQEDIAVGSPIANRNRGELESLIGVFINTVVLRTDLSGEPAFRQLLQRVIDVTLGSYANQDVPFEAVVDRLGLLRDMSHTPLFQVMFILQNAPVRARRLPGITLNQVEVHSGTSTFDLTLVAGEMAEGLSLSVEYNTDLFNRDTIERLVSHYATLLESIVENPDQSIATINILTEPEKRLILETWNDTADDFRTLPSVSESPLDRRDLCVHQLIEQQALKAPEAVAVILPGSESEISSRHISDQRFKIQRLAQLTYGELNARADRVAWELNRYGIQPDNVVGVYLERSVELIVALLGILKAGGAYLPLDPNAPLERLDFIINEATLLSPKSQPVIITHSVLISQLPIIPATMICIDQLWESNPPSGAFDALNPMTVETPTRLPGGADNYGNLVRPENLAYLTYTSGSTGQSKGVMIEHRSLVNAYLAWEKTYELNATDVHLQMANFTFDVFSGDLVRALCSGARLVLCPREWLLAADRLQTLIVAEGINIAEFVPAVLRNLVQFIEKSRQSHDGGNSSAIEMRLLACGSDSWFVGEYRKFQRYLSDDTRLINSFGLTEATIDSTYYEGADQIGLLAPDQLVPIGRPFANTQTYILDRHSQVCPIGIPGELYIGGVGVARGYLNRPDLTSEKFISNPFVDNYLPSIFALQRLYRTGDMARYLLDGNIEFLGRLDDQIKIRGLRIEPGEIEAVLGSHPKIKQAAVVAVVVSLDDKRLAAYLAPVHPHDPPTTGELRRFVQERMPDYMVPSAFVMLDSLPLNPSGKVDRRALSERHGIDWSERLLSEVYVTPRTPTEELLVDLWIQVLGVQQVGVFDNFFELGGHSLLATQLVSRIREIFHLDLPIRKLFESPTVATLAENILAAQQGSLPAGAAEMIPPLVSLPRDPATGLPLQPVPLSFAQQRLWFLDQLEPESPFYNLPEAVRLSGTLDVRVFEMCLNEVVRRHEALRTTFQVQDGFPIQIITPIITLLPIDLAKTDLSQSPGDEREDTALHIAREEAQKPFNLAQGPLLRAHLIKLAADDHIVLLTMHHIIGDNWSSNILVQEVAILYDAYINGRPSPIPELALQYTDYSAWQRNWLQGETLQKQLDYWSRNLKGIPALLDLPTDRPRPSMQTFAGDYRTLKLSAELSQRIRVLSQEQDVTLFMSLLAAFDVLLYRYTGQEDICVGSPIANRTRAEVESLIGFFVNTLVFRSDLSGQPSFKQLLQRVRETALDAYAYQDVPFEMIVDALHPERNLSHSPLFQVMFALQNAPRTAVTLPGSGLRLSPVDSHSGTSKFDLTLFMVDDGVQISGALEFNTDLFDASTIERMLIHFELLLAGFVGDMDKPVTLVPMLTELESRQMLIEWNKTGAPYPQNDCVHNLFEAQVLHTPDAIALSYLSLDESIATLSMTYAQLNRQANLLAHHLRKLGVGPDVLVGLYMERSPELVIGLLGILKSGGAYVPLDPSYPAERIEFMLSDSSAAVVLTQSRLVDRISQDSGIRGDKILCLDADWATIEDAGGGSEIPASVGTPENLAYVIYTSGSTGRPKGTMLTHRGVVNYLTWCLRSYPLGQGLGSPVHSSISFDLTVTSLLSPLVSGATAFLLPEGLGVELLAETIEYAAQQNWPPFSLIKITPAHLQLLGEQLSPDNAKDRTRSFIIGGENLTVDHVHNWLKYSPDTYLVNEYGPTETVVGCCVYWTPPDLLDTLNANQKGVLPIGRPIINTQLYVVDSNLQPVPVGVPGELLIGGLGVARGYLNRDELTAEKFIPNPFLNLYLKDNIPADVIPASQTLYRTGDLARYLPDGNLECLGRIDFQVKIRGFRVELGEIETVIKQYPGIKEAVVWVWEEYGFKNLAAYLVVHENRERTAASDLRQYLQNRLPDYMVPAAFIFLDELPLTPNGKVDRKALPTPDLSRLEIKNAYLAPRTPQEEIIADIFMEILGVNRASAFDNFFELGGHSLLATQVVSRLRDAFQIDFPLRGLFEAPTPAGIAAQIELLRRHTKLEVNNLSQINPIQRDEISGLPKTPAPLSFQQQRLWVIDQLIPGAPIYNTPTFVQVNGSLDVLGLEMGINRVIERHEILRTVFEPVDGKPVQIVLPELRLALPVVDLRSLDEPERTTRAMELARQEALSPFDLAKGPLLRANLLRTGDQQYWILLNTHHIITDDWSLSIFIREVLSFYSTVTNPGSTLADLLPPLTLQYSDYAAWQRDWLQGSILESQLAYWQENLDGLPLVLELPVDRPRPPVQTFNGAQVTFELSTDQLQALKALGRQEGATLFMTTLAIFQVLLSRYTSQEDIAVGTPIANRTRSEVENLIGFFVNTLVMRGDLSDSPDYRTFLRRVRKFALGAYANQDIPFETLVDTLHLQRDMSHHPLFQVMFVHQNAPRQIPSLATDLSLRPVEMHEGIARFDLTLTLTESPFEDGSGICLSGSMEYNTDLFDRETIERMVGHFKMLVDGVISDPDQPLASLSLLTAEEKRLILEEWTQSPGLSTDKYPGSMLDRRCVQTIFEELVEKTPNAQAVVFVGGDKLPDRAPGKMSLSYRQLNNKANLLAERLREHGVGPNALVGICVERSLDMVIALLGILKAGGAYLPLDPAYPKDRLEFMLGDSQVPVLLTHSYILERLPEMNAQVWCLDEMEFDDREQAPNPEINVDLENLAYVIYTSGSTGRPKGVLLRHKGLTNLVQQQIRGFNVDSSSRVLQFASFSFDASVSEVFMGLLSGGCLILAPQEMLTSIPDLLQVMQEQAVTTITLPPTLLRILDPNLVSQALPAFKTLISAGEACPRDVAARWAVDREMYNAYGPTEATIGPTFFPVKAGRDPGTQKFDLVGVPPGCQTTPIGRPIPNMQVYLLDKHKQLVPIGVPGEIHLGGIGLALGYLNQPDLTADKFIPNPFQPGEKFYRTGDLARYLPDGNIEFLGRIDFQVKVRGFRIELGEIEALLNSNSAVKTAVVILREDRPGDKRLVAYVVPAETEQSERSKDYVADLAGELRERLPEYMVPATIIIIDRLPVTPNGKVDRKALPPPDQTWSSLATPYVAPRSETEQILSDLWMEVLGVKPTEERPTIGISDNFFELGGDSILSIQIASRAVEAGLRVTPRDLFERPTIAGLAERIIDNISPQGAMQQGQLAAGSEDAVGDDFAQFGWSKDDLGGILGAIESTLDDADNPAEESIEKW